MLPHTWRLSIGVVRAALGIGCLSLYLTWSITPLTPALLPLLAFVAYSFLMLWRSMDTGGTPLAAIVVDTTAFVLWLLLSAAFADRGPLWLWLSLTASIYLFLLATAIVTQEWPAAIAVAAVCVSATSFAPGQDSLLRPIAIWCTVLGAVWLLHRRHLDGRLARAARHSVRYRFEAQHAREDERQRMAADFHDGPLQSFIGLQMRLEILKKLLARDPQSAQEELRQLQELCRSQVGELRTFVRSMRPADVDGASLGASISRMVEQFQKDTGVMAAFLSEEYVNPPDIDVSLEILQIIREALNNVRKHARATQVTVTLAKQGESLEVTVEDDGDGFRFSGSYSLDELDLLRLGPVSIRRRVRGLGGDLRVDSRPGQGAGLKVRIALA
jgi:signal transduction histidine kinase